MALAIVVVSGMLLLGLVALYAFGRRRARALTDPVCLQIASLPERRKNQHVVDLQLRDGRVVRKVWIAYGRFPAVIGGGMLFRRYQPEDVVAALPHQP